MVQRELFSESIRIIILFRFRFFGRIDSMFMFGRLLWRLIRLEAFGSIVIAAGGLWWLWRLVRLEAVGGIVITVRLLAVRLTFGRELTVVGIGVEVAHVSMVGILGIDGKGQLLGIVLGDEEYEEAGHCHCQCEQIADQTEQIE